MLRRDALIVTGYAAAQARLTALGVGIDAGNVPRETVRLMMQGRTSVEACI